MLSRFAAATIQRSSGFGVARRSIRRRQELQALRRFSKLAPTLSARDLLTNKAQQYPHNDAILRNKMPVIRDELSWTSEREAAKRQEILDYFHNTYTFFEELHMTFNSPVAFFVKHETLRHPPIFYLGHGPSFFMNKLNALQVINMRFDPVLEMQCAVGVDEMSWDDLDAGSYVWPSPEEAAADPERAEQFLKRVLDFRTKVRELVGGLIKTQPMQWPITSESFWWVILMGIEHDRIHCETSSVIIRQADISLMRNNPMIKRCTLGRFDEDPSSNARSGSPKNELIDYPEGSTTIGRTLETTSTWGWDNEFGIPQQHAVHAFKASKYLASNAEFYNFVQDQGYVHSRFWTEIGWKWVSTFQVKQPRFWRTQDGGYKLRLISEEIAMPWDWPVEVNHHEAAAFCAWLAEKTGKPIRLPCEKEYYRLRDDLQVDVQDSGYAEGWSVAPGNINMEHFMSACPVNLFMSPNGFGDVIGNVWQHNLNFIDVLPGFRTHPLYEDFTVPTIDGEHTLIFGGSFISSGAAGAARDNRYGFKSHFYQHAGFRYIESDVPVDRQAIPFENKVDVCNQFRFHFSEGNPITNENFPARLAAVTKEAAEAVLGERIADLRIFELGCGPGRTMIEMTRLGAKEVHAADVSAKSFHNVDHFLLNGPGTLRWADTVEGELVEYREIFKPDVESGNIYWHQTPDMSEVDSVKFHGMDVLIVAQPDSISKTMNPSKMLRSLHRSVRPGGILVLGTTYNWKSDGSTLGKSGEDIVANQLAAWWEPVLKPTDIPFAFQETGRKYNCGKQHVTFWRRRAEQATQVEDLNSMASTDVYNEGQGQHIYDDEAILGQYMDFHFMEDHGNYPVACAAKCAEVAKEFKVPTRRALEIGGGPGRAALELSKIFDHVDGGDYSKTFVAVAQDLAEKKSVQWKSCVDMTGSTTVDRSFSLEENGIDSKKVSFHVMDAHNLPEDLTNYDLICGFNLIDRLEHPAQALAHIKERLNVGGLLVLSSPYTWQEAYTPKENWLGGYKYGDNDGPKTGDGLAELMKSIGFKPAKTPEDLWFTLKEQADGRRFQRTRAEISVFQRVA